jgi:hypothetical protein
MDKKKLANSIKNIVKQVIKENLEAAPDPNEVKAEVFNGLKGLYNSIKGEYGIKMDEFANICTSILAKYTSDHMNENNPAPAPSPGTSPNPTIAPTKPGTKPGPREPLFPDKDNPDTKPKAEKSVINKIEQRFKSLTK